MNTPRSIALSLTLATTLSSMATAQIQRDHDITIDDYFTIANITGCISSPSATHVAYTEMRWDESLD